MSPIMCRGGATLVAAACLLAACALSSRHPLEPVWLTVAAIAWSAVVWRWPSIWLVVLPALLPIADLSPWTGWVAIGEFDVLVLATAAGGYLRLAQESGPGVVRQRLPGRFRWLVATLVVAVSVALGRGISDAGGLSWDFFGGYTHSMNSLRVGKAFFLALLLLPLLQRAFAADAQQAVERWVRGVVAGLALVALTAVWERVTYPGLLDFSYVYRVTAGFWEMHVGGAAIDGYLALTIPFVAWGLLEGKSRWRWLASAALAVMAGYAVLMTFSRGIYLAVPLSLITLAVLRARQRAAGSSAAGLSARARLAVGVCLVAAVQCGFWLAGYRGAGVVVGTVFGAMIVNALRAAPWWPSSLRTQGGIAVALLLITESLAVANGSSFLLERLRSSERDLGSRWGHWHKGIALLDSPGKWLLGEGLGRMPSHYGVRNDGEEIPADFRRTSVAGRDGVVLVGPPSRPELAGLFGMAQRVGIQPNAGYSVAMDVWNVAETTLLVSLCQKHLLYPVGCIDGTAKLKPVGGWQRVTVPLAGSFAGTPWYARRQGVLALALADPGRAVVVGRVSLAAQGRETLENGDFAAGLSRWFLDGRLYFQPWHIDNLWLEALLDGGLLLVAALFLAWLGTFWHLVFGDARRHLLASILAAALLGHCVIGLFASQMDAPRAFFLMLLVMLIAWVLPTPGDDDSSIRQRRVSMG